MSCGFGRIDVGFHDEQIIWVLLTFVRYCKDNFEILD